MRIISMLMVLAMLLSFAACVKNPDTPDTTDPADATTAPAETTAPPEDLSDNLPEETFNNQEILIWEGHNEHSSYFNPDPEAEGDVVSEAALKRNSNVEERFDVVFKWMVGDTGADLYTRNDQLRNGILAGDRLDIVDNAATYLGPYMVAGCFLNLADNEILDFSRPWYFDYVIDNLRINDRLYATSGWYDFNTVRQTSIFFFNIEMAENNQVGDLYQMVYDGKWTYDKMMEIAESVGADMNNDGVYNDDDRYGLAGMQDQWFQQVYTTGYSFVTTNEDGTLTVSGIDDRLIHAFDTVRKIFDSTWYQSFYTYGEARRPNEDLYNAFNNGRLLFYMGLLMNTANPIMRDGGKFGLLPTPKFYEENEYGSAALPYVSCIPITTENARTSSIILEALHAETYKEMRPAFFDVALSYKYVNDATSREMLDIAMDNLYCDFGYMYMDTGFGREIPMTLTRATNLSSWMATHTAATNAGLKALVDQIMELPE